MAGLTRRVVGVGLTSLLPVGETRARRSLMAGAMRRLASEAGQPLDDATLELLLPVEPGRLSSAGRAFGRGALRAVLGQVTGVLTLKDSLEHTVELALRLEMLRMALDAGLLPAHAEAVGAAMSEVLGSQGHTPLGRALLKDGLGRDPALFGSERAVERAVRELITLGDGALVLRAFEDRLRGLRVNPGL